MENPVWHKMALTWPVDATGENIPVSQWRQLSNRIYHRLILGFAMASGRMFHSRCSAN